MAERKKASEVLTPLELQIMQALWAKGPSNVLAVQEYLGRKAVERGANGRAAGLTLGADGRSKGLELGLGGVNVEVELGKLEGLAGRGEGELGARMEAERGAGEKLDEVRPAALAYTTVQTMLNVLIRKNKVRRTQHGRTYEYEAVVSEETASRHAVRDMLDRMFGGRVDGLLMNLMKDHQLSAEKLAELSERMKAEDARRETQRNEKQGQKESEHD